MCHLLKIGSFKVIQMLCTATKGTARVRIFASFGDQPFGRFMSRSSAVRNGSLQFHVERLVEQRKAVRDL